MVRAGGSVKDIFLGLGDVDSAAAKEGRRVGSWRVRRMLSGFMSIYILYSILVNTRW